MGKCVYTKSETCQVRRELDFMYDNDGKKLGVFAVLSKFCLACPVREILVGGKVS